MPGELANSTIEFITQPFVSNKNTIWFLLMAVLVSLPCSLLGCFLLLRRMALMGDAISHSVLPGIVVAFLIVKDLSSTWLIFGAALAGLLVSMLIELIHTKTRVKQDAAIGISFTTLFAIGVLLVSLFVQKQTDLHVDCIISGDIAKIALLDTVNIFGHEAPYPLINAAIIGGITIAAIFVFYRLLMISSFDPGLTASFGINPKIVHYLLMAVLSLVVVSSFRAVGAILVIALLIIPAASAYLCTHRLKTMLFLAGLHSILSSVVAIYIYTNFECSISAAMVVGGVLLFIAAWIFGPVDGILWKWKRKYWQAEAFELGESEN